MKLAGLEGNLMKIGSTTRERDKDRFKTRGLCWLPCHHSLCLDLLLLLFFFLIELVRLVSGPALYCEPKPFV